MRAPKSSRRVVLELYTLCKFEYKRTVPVGPYSGSLCTEREFQACWKELSPRWNWMTRGTKVTTRGRGGEKEGEEGG